jgi:hypothetical protein
VSRRSPGHPGSAGESAGIAGYDLWIQVLTEISPCGCLQFEAKRRIQFRMWGSAACSSTIKAEDCRTTLANGASLSLRSSPRTCHPSGAVGRDRAGTRPTTAKTRGGIGSPERYWQVKTGTSSVWRCRSRWCRSAILVEELCPVNLDGALYCGVCGSPMKRLHVSSTQVRRKTGKEERKPS